MERKKKIGKTEVKEKISRHLVLKPIYNYEFTARCITASLKERYLAKLAILHEPVLISISFIHSVADFITLHSALRKGK